MTELVHTPLARWAHEFPQRCAIACGNTRISFAQLHHTLTTRAQQLQHAPATCLVDDTQDTLHQLIEFLSIVYSGRCAAVSDPDWPAHVRQTVVSALPQNSLTARATQSTDAFYIGFTSGSTGVPKGFQRHHQSWVESFRVCADTFGLDSHAAILAPGRISHSLFLFGMLMGLWSGAGVTVQSQFSASHTLATLQAGEPPCLVAVPSQLLMLLQWAQHRQLAPIASVRWVLISGARWMRQHTEALQALFPNARLIEFYGASETSFIAWKDATEPATPDAVGRPFANVDIDIRPTSPNTTQGLIYVRSPMLFMNYVGPQHDATAAVRDGDWLSVGDLGYRNAQGHVCLSGRQNRMIVTQGKNLFPEELEQLLTTHPHIAQASVHALPDPLRGARVVAVLQWQEHAPASTRPTARALQTWLRTRIESYKMPRHVYVCAAWPLTASGKTDHARLHQAVQDTLDPTHANASTCLHSLS